MNLLWSDPRGKKTISNVGLITSDGPNGPNIMSAESTYIISRSPLLIAVFVSPNHATHANIEASKEFGVSLAAEDQNIVASIAGGSAGTSENKIAALKELDVEFYQAKQINTLLVKGASLNAECRVKEAIPLGDHTLFVGEVLELTVSEKESLAYAKGKYWKLTEQIQKPAQEELDRINAILEKFKK